MQLVIATSNAGKCHEIQQLLAPLNFNCITQGELDIESAEETGQTFIENAILKARHAATLSGKPALADDSGLVVPALDGAPGIYSARYAGDNATDEDRYNKLLQEMASIDDNNRQAYFTCALAFFRYANDPAPIVAQGLWHGEILKKPQGNNGFGYDPVVFIPELQQSAAELDADIKNTHSHRAKAMLHLISELEKEISETTS